MMNKLFTAIIIVFFFSCHQPALQPVTTDIVQPAEKADTATITKQVLPEQLISPGKSIGHLAILQSADSAIAMLGKPDSSDAAMGSSLMVWYAGHNPKGYKTAIFAHRNMGGKDELINRIKKIMVTSPWFKTAGGISAGTMFSEIEKQYSLKPAGTFTVLQKKVIAYDDVDKGITFDIDSASKKCVAVTVHAPKDSSGTYLDMH